MRAGVTPRVGGGECARWWGSIMVADDSEWERSWVRWWERWGEEVCEDMGEMEGKEGWT